VDGVLCSGDIDGDGAGHRFHRIAGTGWSLRRVARGGSAGHVQRGNW
jgi:hypothetical protein